MTESGRKQANRATRLPRIALSALVLVAAVVAVYGYTARNVAAQQQTSPLVGMVSVYPYNFTPYKIVYSLMPGRTWDARANAARGTSVQTFGYKPETAESPLKVSWRYASGPEATPDGEYPFQVTLPQPKRPQGSVVLELRMYPQGKVAARYVTLPLVSEFSNVDPELPGNDWVTNR